MSFTRRNKRKNQRNAAKDRKQQMIIQRIDFDNGETIKLVNNLHTYDDSVANYIQAYIEKHNPKRFDLPAQQVLCGEIMAVRKEYFAMPEELFIKTKTHVKQSTENLQED